MSKSIMVGRVDGVGWRLDSLDPRNYLSHLGMRCWDARGPDVLQCAGSPGPSGQPGVVCVPFGPCASGLLACFSPRRLCAHKN